MPVCACVSRHFSKSPQERTTSRAFAKFSRAKRSMSIVVPFIDFHPFFQRGAIISNVPLCTETRAFSPLNSLLTPSGKAFVSPAF